MNKMTTWYQSVLTNKSCSESTMLLILRVVAGVAMAMHGYGKIQDPFHWMGAEAPVPGFFQMLAAVAEFGGGIAWVLGFLTPIASFGVACTMAVAVFVHVSKGDPFVGMEGSYELAAIYFAISMVLMFGGPGKLSVDSKICGALHCEK